MRYLFLLSLLLAACVSGERNGSRTDESYEAIEALESPERYEPAEEEGPERDRWDEARGK